MNNEVTTEREDFDMLNQPKMGTGLNVVTILTMIGSVIQFISSIWAFANARKSYEETPKMIEQMSGEDVPEIAKTMMGDPDQLMEMVTKSYENRLPILILGVIASILCFYGALQMRKLKKQGYTIYMIGEVLPFITAVAFIGMVAFSGVGMWISVAIALIFIIIYTVMRKKLIY